jgi:hypothetical protein
MLAQFIDQALGGVADELIHRIALHRIEQRQDLKEGMSFKQMMAWKTSSLEEKWL